MRIVVWNAAWNTRKRPHEGVVALLALLGADVAVVSETSRPAKAGSPRCFWIGPDEPGLGVYVRDGFRVEPDDPSPDVPRYFVPLRISGEVSFQLLAAWPTKLDASSYQAVLMRGLEAYGSRVATEPTVLAGDLNASARVIGQEAAHPKFLAALEQLDLLSAYHHLGPHRHGEEPQQTFLPSASSDRGFHLDYCFASRRLLRDATARLGDREDWRRVGDHLPLIVNLPNANFSSGAVA